MFVEGPMAGGAEQTSPEETYHNQNEIINLYILYPNVSSLKKTSNKVRLHQDLDGIHNSSNT